MTRSLIELLKNAELKNNSWTAIMTPKQRIFWKIIYVDTKRTPPWLLECLWWCLLQVLSLPSQPRLPTGELESFNAIVWNHDSKKITVWILIVSWIFHLRCSQTNWESEVSIELFGINTIVWNHDSKKITVWILMVSFIFHLQCIQT